VAAIGRLRPVRLLIFVMIERPLLNLSKMYLFSIIASLFFLSSCQSTGPAHSSYDDCVRNASDLMRTFASVTLQEDEFARLKQIAVEAATSSAAWGHFGGQRIIEGPFNVDPTQIEYEVLSEDRCRLIGAVERDAKCDRIMLTVPTNQHGYCTDIFIVVTVDRESGKVVDMHDWSLTQIGCGIPPPWENWWSWDESRQFR